MSPKRNRKRAVSPAPSAAGASGSGQQVQGQGQAAKVAIAERRQVIKAGLRNLVEAARPDLSPAQVDAVVAEVNKRMIMGSKQCVLAAVLCLAVLLQSFLGQPTPGFPAAGPAPGPPPPPDPACPPYAHPRLVTRNSPRTAAAPAQLPPPVQLNIWDPQLLAQIRDAMELLTNASVLEHLMRGPHHRGIRLLPGEVAVFEQPSSAWPVAMLKQLDEVHLTGDGNSLNSNATTIITSINEFYRHPGRFINKWVKAVGVVGGGFSREMKKNFPQLDPPAPPPAQGPPPPPAQEPPPPAQDQPPAPAAPCPVPRPQGPPWGRWLDRDTNPCLHFQRIGESRQRPIELCSYKGLMSLPPVGKEYQQGYKLVNDRLPKVKQRLHRAAEYRRVLEPWTPLFHCATLASLLHLLLRRGLTTRTLAWALLTDLLATSQHTLALHNQGKLLPELRRAAATLRIYRLPPWGMGQSTHAGQGAGACLIPGLSAGSSSSRIESSIVCDHCHESSRSSSRPEQLHAAGQVQNVALSVTGVKCEGCARSLRQALLRTEGVLQCEVDFKAKQVRVAFNASATNITLLVAAVVEVDASYEAAPLDTPTSQFEGCMGRA
ncbi:hypothetical protein QJQ45_001515 [Haematococcus lacustris]|nr:hypothetical protein QJQ45_001515 [Haematococcus lacustris]